MSQSRRTKSSSTQQLVDDLLAESHGLRMKYEDFSRYTEAQVAEFVLTKRRLNRELAELGERAKFLTQKVDQLENANTHLEQIRAHLTRENRQLSVQVEQLFEARRQLEDAKTHLEQIRAHLTAESARLTVELEATREHLRQQLAHVQAERDAAQAEAVRIGVELRHAHGDIALLHEQRAMVQGELVRITHECSALQLQLAKRTEQRDRLRNRVQALESSRIYRFSQAIRRLLRR